MRSHTELENVSNQFTLRTILFVASMRTRCIWYKHCNSNHFFAICIDFAKNKKKSKISNSHRERVFLNDNLQQRVQWDSESHRTDSFYVSSDQVQTSTIQHTMLRIIRNLKFKFLTHQIISFRNFEFLKKYLREI
jgi:hypothetical protein